MQLKLKDGIIGQNCAQKAGLCTKWNFTPHAKRFTEKTTVEQMKEFLKEGRNFKDISDQYKTPEEIKEEKEKIEREKKKIEYEKTLALFKEHHAKKFSHYYFDLVDNKILCAKTFLSDPEVIDFKNVVSYQINKNGHTEHKKHGVTRAVVGGALAGGVGAIVGATTGGKNQDYIDHLGVVINLSNGNNFEVVIKSSWSGKDKASSLNNKWNLSDLNNLVSTIQAGMNAVAKDSLKERPALSEADIPTQIRKYKQLVDDGIITNEEFELKKKELLKL